MTAEPSGVVGDGSPTGDSTDDFVRYCCGKPDCPNDCERETPPVASSSGTGREYPPELVHGELCATRFGANAECDCGKSEPAASSGTGHDARGQCRVIWWGWRRSWPPVKYVHRSRFGGFRELLIGPLGFVWNYDQELAVKEAMHGRQD